MKRGLSGIPIPYPANQRFVGQANLERLALSGNAFASWAEQ